MKDYKFTCVPKNLMLALDGNCKIMFFTLVQYSDYTAGEDGWFYAPNTTLQTQAGLSKNLVIATLDTLYQAGVIDIECIGVGVGHKSNKIKLNTSSFDKYNNYKVDEILANPELQIHTVNYKNNYSPSYIPGGKKVCKKVNTIIDNIDNIDNIKNIDNIDNIDNVDNIKNIDNKNISNNNLIIDIPIKEKENLREKESQNTGTGMGDAPVYLKNFYLNPVDVFNLPKEEQSLQFQFNDIMRRYKEFKRKGVDEDNYQHQVIDWEEGQEVWDMLKYISEWDAGGRRTLAEEVQGYKADITKEILIYLVNYQVMSRGRMDEG